MERVSVVDKTCGRVLAGDAAVARRVFDRMKGLLGRRSLPRGSGLVITPCASIHTVGMRFPIDAVFFDRGKRVVAVVRRVGPFRFTKLYTRATGVIELPAGTADEVSVRPGDELEFRPASGGGKEQEGI